MATIKERVQAGAALLDKVLPDWWNGKETPTIDLEILNMSCGGDCVLGQAYGSYLRGSQMLGLPFYGSGVNNAGFNAVDEDRDQAPPTGRVMNRVTILLDDALLTQLEAAVKACGCGSKSAHVRHILKAQG